jgi:putative ABC transport system permease protein
MLQVAVAMILLVGAGLLVGSVQRLMAVDPGFKTDSRLAFRVSLPSTTYPNDESQIAFFRTLIERLGQLPGVRAAGISTLSPFDVRNDTATFHVEGVDEGPGSKPLGSELREISGGYPAAIGMPILRGRTFNDQDRAGSPYIVLVDQRTADRLWPGQNPLGKRLRFGPAWREVVGVVGTVKNERLDAEGQYQIYGPFLQSPAPNMTVVIQAVAEAPAVMRSVRETVSNLDRNVPVFDVRPLEERVRESLAPRRYSMMLLGGFGLAGALVSVIGIYGVLAYAVRQRTQEIGVRSALGATRRQLLWMIVRQGTGLALIGVAFGSLGALWLTRFLESMLYGVKSTDPLTFILVAITLMAAALIASYVPARRAARLDPVAALRGE